jgi:hypothetical protein
MATNLLKVDDFYHKIYYESCPEFEEVRELCLSEDNWLRNIYTKDQLILENHVGYAVMYHRQSGEPAGMAGLFNDGRYPGNIARHLHRGYLFPKFRQNTYKGIVNNFKIFNRHLVKPLNTIKKFDAYFIAIQNRHKKDSVGYWRILSSAICKAIPGFKPIDGYIQTCPWPVQECWQHYVYFEHVPESWTNWIRPIMVDNEWAQLPAGE